MGRVKFDLHLHTDRSDGSATPEALVWKASARDLDVIAVTDHDTTAGFRAARAEGPSLGVRVLAGAEVTAEVPLDDHAPTIHLIALGLDPEHDGLQSLLARTRDGRERAARESLGLLARAGHAVAPDSLPVRGEGSSYGRPHVADLLVKAGVVRSRREAFDLYLAGDAFKGELPLPTAEEAIRAIHAAGGLAIWAHPFIEVVDELIEPLVGAGLDGLEVHRPGRPGSPRPLYLEAIARRFDLLVSGGSDWHGRGALGEHFVTDEQIGPLAGALLERC